MSIMPISNYDSKDYLESPVIYQNISVGNSFTLRGGKYFIACVASNYGTVRIRLKAPNGLSYGVGDAGCAVSFSANGAKTMNFPPGTYNLSFT